MRGTTGVSSLMVMLSWLVAMATADASEKRMGCYLDQYECYYYYTCIPDYNVCDGHEDCPYGDDEENCATTNNPDSSNCPDYECLDGTCIPDYWVCDGVADCPLHGDDEYHCYSHSDATDVTTTTPPFTTKIPWPETTLPPTEECGSAYDFIHDRCILVDPFTLTSWDEARYLCQKFNGDLVVIDDFNFYSKLMQYIIVRGLDTHNYWVGASDPQEGVWRWIDNTPVHVGAPLWALYGCTNDYHLEPRSVEASFQDCGFLDKTRGLYMSDASCDQEYAAICQETS